MLVLTHAFVSDVFLANEPTGRTCATCHVSVLLMDISTWHTAAVTACKRSHSSSVGYSCMAKLLNPVTS